MVLDIICSFQCWHWWNKICDKFVYALLAAKLTAQDNSGAY